MNQSPSIRRPAHLFPWVAIVLTPGADSFGVPLLVPHAVGGGNTEQEALEVARKVMHERIEVIGIQARKVQ